MAVVDWFIDGRPIRRGSVRHVVSREGWHNVTPLVGQNIGVPNRSGEIWVPKKVGAGAFSLDIWLQGRDDQEINDEWDNLLRLTIKPHRLITVEKRLPNQEVRYCQAEFTGGIQPTVVGRHGMRASMQFRIPSGLWRSQRTYTYKTSPGESMPQQLPMPGLADSTAPIETAQITIHGPITNPTVSSLVDETEHQMSYDGVIPAGASLTIHSGRWAMSGTGFTPNVAALGTTGSRLMVLNPSNGPKVRLYGSGTGPGTHIEVEAKSAYIA